MNGKAMKIGGGRARNIIYTISETCNEIEPSVSSLKTRNKNVLTANILWYVGEIIFLNLTLSKFIYLTR